MFFDQLLSRSLSTSNLLLVTPNQPVGFIAQEGLVGVDQKIAYTKSFLFDFEGEQSVTLESDIANHVVEDNSNRQDQITLKPLIITTRGYIGELTNTPSRYANYYNLVSTKLTELTAFAPELTVMGTQVLNQAVQLEKLQNNITNSVDSLEKLADNGRQVGALNTTTNKDYPADNAYQSKQQLAFARFYFFWQKRTLFTLQTPWAIFSNMAIKSLKALQEEENAQVSTFEISFQEIRTARTKITPSKNNVVSGQLKNQSAAQVSQGVTRPEAAGTLSTLIGGGK